MSIPRGFHLWSAGLQTRWARENITTLMTAAEARVWSASRIAGHTSSAMVDLYDSADHHIGRARRSTVTSLECLDLLVADESHLNDDGHGDITWTRDLTKLYNAEDNNA